MRPNLQCALAAVVLLSLAGCRERDAVAPPDLAPARRPHDAAFPGTNGKIAFTSDRDGNREIYTMNPDGSMQQNVTNNPSYDDGPAWSPDASKIAFFSNRGGNLDIYVMNADGTGVTPITTDPADDIAPTWSPDGSKIAFISTRSGTQNIYVMNADGTGVTRLTFTSVRDFRPQWSPDGARIAFWSERDGNYEIYVMDANGSNVTRLTFNGADDYDPWWSPDGSRLVFWSGGGNSHDIYVMNADGTGVVDVTPGPFDDATPAWSPDGTKIVFNSNRVGNYGICVMDANGSNINCVTTTPDGGPDWGRAAPPLYPFVGFFKPLTNADTVNVVKAGSSVPVKFSLGGDLGLDIFTSGAPSSAAYACGSGPSSLVDEAAASTNSGLQFDPTTNQYTYVWKTSKSWAGTCRLFTLGLNDGSTHTARFSFK